MRLIRSDSQGQDVRDVQQRLIQAGFPIERDELQDGRFAESTAAATRSFQQARGLPADGIVGPDTWAALVESGYALGDRTLYLRYPWFRGDDVRALQRALNALGFDAWREDGIFGERVDRAVREFQRNVGHADDGIVGPGTYEAVARLRPDPNAPSRAEVREAEEVRRGGRLEGAWVAIDAGHGPGDPGAVGPTGLEEFEAVYRLATALTAELERRGAKPKLLRRELENPAVSERADAANAMEAAACISLHLGDGDPAAEGSTVLFFGSDRSHSPAGERLAESIQEQLCERMSLLDGRIHPMSIPLLRETRMPAVQVEPCFVTNEREEAQLREERFITDVAVAIAVGLERFLEPALESGPG